MSDFWKDIKQSFSSPKQEPNDTVKAILDIENKKQTITHASNNEQNSIKSNISDEYRKIGQITYALYKGGTFDIEKIAGMFETVRDLYQTLSEKQAKLSEILSRYDEELKILRPLPTGGQGICPHCSFAYIPGDMVFCARCGNKLDAAEETTDKDESESAILPAQKECANCNTTNIADAVFCLSCGSKL